MQEASGSFIHVDRDLLILLHHHNDVYHYNDGIMSAMVTQMTDVSIVYSTV